MVDSRTEPPSAERAALLALGATVLLLAAKVTVWVITSSLVVLSQALDSLIDVVALGVVYVAVRLSGKPADESHHYGHAKAENLAAYTQTLILIGVVSVIAVQAAGRLAGAPGQVNAPWYALALLALSIVMDVARVRVVARAARAHGSEALRAGTLNLTTDIATATVALAALGLVRAGIQSADAIGALLVAAAVAVAAVRVGRRSMDVLMDRAPEEPAEAIAQAAARAPGVAETRRVRVRRGGDRLFADVTVAASRTASLERAHDIAEGVEREIERAFPGADVVVHVEPAGSHALVARVQAAASRVEDVTEVHNVLVHAFQEGGTRKLHVTLHAKVEPGATVEQAHGISDLIEAAVEAEIGPDVRVDTHLEPLGAAARARDVTAERADLVRAVEAIALQEPDVRDCHEVLLTSARGTISVVAHVHGRGDLPLQRIHAASERIENALRRDHREVGGVVIHFEPEPMPGP
ncbi:MAG: cation-efflux pump [Actinomycetota bacterium]